MNRRLSIALAACAIGLTSVACAESDTAGPQPDPTTVATQPEADTATSTTDPTIATSQTDSPATEPSEISDPPADDSTCLTADSPAVLDAAAALAPPNGRDQWVIDAVGGKPFPGCLALQWVLLSTPGGTASSGYHVMFFHDNQFVSTANTFATAYTQVVDETDNSVSVQYRWLEDSDASCCPQGGPIVVTYTWDGDAVAQDPPLPDEMVDSYSR